MNEYSIHTSFTESAMFWMSTYFVDSYRISKDYYKAMPIITLDLSASCIIECLCVNHSMLVSIHICKYFIFQVSTFLSIQKPG